MQPTFFKHARSVVGPFLVGIGVFILSGNLDRAVAELSGHVAELPRQALGIMPAAIVASSRVAKDYAMDHERFFQILFLHLLASLWPLLLVGIGAVLSPADSRHSDRNTVQGAAEGRHRRAATFYSAFARLGQILVHRD